LLESLERVMAQSERQSRASSAAREQRSETLRDELLNERRRATPMSRAFTMLKKNRLGVIGAVVLTIISVMAITAPVLAPHDPNIGTISDRLICPFLTTCPDYRTPGTTQSGVSSHILGTDQLGRDILTRIMYGAQVSLIVGLSAVLLGAGFGATMGLISGYYGGNLDALVMRIGDIFLAFPFLLLAIALMAVLGGGLFNVILVLAISTWVPYARLMRGNVLSAKEQEYTIAARAIGAHDASVLFRHLFPNCVTPIIVFGTFMVANAIILEASLSFLGLGVGGTRATWGGMLADGREYVSTAWWLATMPGLAIVVTVLSINMMGDWLRDVLDPQLRNRE
jgi:peptide/nickel transport system permease protein